MTEGPRVAVVGAGAWGTAIACHLAARAHAAPRVVLVARSTADVDAMRLARRNEHYLPGVALPEKRQVSSGNGSRARAKGRARPLLTTD